VASLAALGCSTGASIDSTQSQPPNFGIGPANRPLPPGAWKAIGVVTSQPATYSNQPVGAVLKRPWTFVKSCKSSCHTLFLRQTLYGPSATELVPTAGGLFTAVFPPVTVPCYYTRDYSGPRHPFGQSHDSYKLWWSADRGEIHAVELRTQTGCYPTAEAPDVTRWRATRASAGGTAALGRS
jgi:hypothetical protein